MSDLLVNQEYIMDKIDNLYKKVEEVRVEVATLPERILEKSDQKYASKTTEKLVYGMVAIILVSFLSSVVYLAFHSNTFVSALTTRAK